MTPHKNAHPVRAARTALGRRGLKLVIGGMALSAALLSVAAVPAAQAAPAPAQATKAALPPIKHVWFIILENKSYDATFSGLNNNSYLWKTLPAQGTLLNNYYGTGHFSLDNYVALASGQAPQYDHQIDCPVYKDMAGTMDTTPGDPNFGQFVAAAQNSVPGCVYPSSVPTLFNQVTAAGVSWKAYGQDLGYYDTNATGTAPSQVHNVYCGAPSNSPTSYPVANPGGANATDQFVGKHFPTPWFHSILDNTSNCNSSHVASLFDPYNGLYHDLQKASTTPAFSWISPNNCSDAHDAVCYGNNLSGGWLDANTPKPPVNYTGGLYASDLFLQHIVPEIEASPAFKQGGLIDITFDEGFPAFTFTGNSFNNSTTDTPNAASSIAADSAGENINGVNVNSEPTGPNTPLAQDANGNQLLPGPGFNAFIDRDPTIPGIVLGGSRGITGARTDASANSDGTTNVVNDNSAVITDQGRSVTGTNIPAGTFVGTVTDTPVNPDSNGNPQVTTSLGFGGFSDTGSFTLVDGNGAPVSPTGPISGVVLGARTTATDPLFDATHATTGGGDVGAVLISKYIKPGSTDSTFYNHYSWLKSMEDIFGVASASPGIDGAGHLGFAAQSGLKGFGSDVFTCWGVRVHC